MCESQFSFIKLCVCRSSSCLCYPFSATLPWRQCPPGVMGDECARAIYSFTLPLSLSPSIHLPLFSFVSLSLPHHLSHSLHLCPLPSATSPSFPLSFSLLPLLFLPLSDWLNALLLKMRYCLMRQRVRKRGRGDKEQVS